MSDVGKLLSDVGKLRYSLGQARDKLAEQDRALAKMQERANSQHVRITELRAFAEQVNQSPAQLALVLSVRKNTALLDASGNMIEMPLASLAGAATWMREGIFVKLHPQTGGIIGKSDCPPDLGAVVPVTTIIDDGVVEVDTQGEPRVVRCTGKLAVGDRVVLDRSGSVVIRLLPKVKVQTDDFKRVSWQQIGGLIEAKAALRDAIESPVKNAELFKRFNRKAARGALLYGPPGCGKTLLGAALATSVADTYEQELMGSGYIYVKGPELLDPYVGVTEAKIRALFFKARAHKREHGYPSVIFIDEADAVLQQRGSRRSSDVDMTIVPQFLAELDGLEDSGAFVLLATNRANALDAAVVREGRIDKHIFVDRPDKSTSAQIAEIYLTDKPCTGAGPGELAALIAEQLFSQERVLAKLTVRNGAGTKPVSFTLGDMVSGAMIATVVEDAASIAMREAMSGNDSGGLVGAHLEQAVGQVFEGHRRMRHDGALSDWAAQHNYQIVNRVHV